MKTLILLTVLFAFKPSVLRDDAGQTPIQIIENHGYPNETHYITTEDGYILTYFRLPQPKKTPILIVHGLFSSGTDFINGGNESLGYLLYNAGYDVWLANVRGNTFSRNHTTLDPEADAKVFYNFSWHEIGYYDLPAAIDYILNKTNESALHYIGHSQGTTSFLVLMSTRPEYNKKVKIGHMMAPVVIMKHAVLGWFTLIFRLVDKYQDVFRSLGVYHMRILSLVRRVGWRFCMYNTFICSVLYRLLVKSKKFDDHLVPVILTNAPADVSINQVVHFGQLITAGVFQQYDHGTQQNLKIYGSKKPPVYDLEKVVAPLAIYYSQSDRVTSVEDVQALIKQLPNVVLDEKIRRKSFNHLDFLWATDNGDGLYKTIIETSEKYQ